MKKYLSIFLILFAIMATETSCETNGAEQAKNMADWSPAGKMYINEDFSEEELKEEGVEYLVTVIHFVNEDSVRIYTTPNKDLTYNSDFYNFLWKYTYSGEYPRFVLENKGNTRILKFIDENSCYFASESKWVYTQVSD